MTNAHFPRLTGLKLADYVYPVLIARIVSEKKYMKYLNESLNAASLISHGPKSTTGNSSRHDFAGTPRGPQSPGGQGTVSTKSVPVKRPPDKNL